MSIITAKVWRAARWFLPLACLGGGAHASDFFCDNYAASGSAPQNYQCVQTTVGPGAPLIVSPDQVGSGVVSAESASSGSGPFASASFANAVAGPGLLRGYASAEMLGGSIDGAQAVGRSDAWFSDGGTFAALAGASIGDPLKVRFTLDIAGGFAGGAGFNALSEARADLFGGIFGGAQVRTSTTINRFNNTAFQTFDVDARVGDTFGVLMKLHVQAGAVNDGKPGDAMSIADVSNTSHLYIDVLSGNASLVSLSGHQYASTATEPDPGTTPSPVPEPSTYALLLAGLALVGAGARRRGPRGSVRPA